MHHLTNDVADRRRFPRVSFGPPAPGSFGGTPVRILDLSVAGALVEHATPFTSSGPRDLSFEWYEPIEVDARIVRCESHDNFIRSALEIPVPSAALVRSVALRLSSARIARLESLVEASKLVNSAIEPDDLVESILTVARNELGVNRGAVYFVDQERQEIWTDLRGEGPSEAIRFPIGVGLAGDVARTGRTLMLEDAYSDTRFDETVDLVSGFPTGSVLCTPVHDRDRLVIGVIQLVHEEYRSFSSGDRAFLEAISEHVAIAMRNAAYVIDGIERNRMLAELRLGQHIQKRLLPLAPDSWQEVTVAASSVPCFEVGGDYHDFIELPDGDYGLAIGDVSGKGVAAALIMSGAQAALRIAAPGETDLARLIARLDALLLSTTPPEKFATFFFGRYSRRTNILRYVNAGHTAPLVSRDGHIVRLETTGPPLGILQHGRFREESVHLETGSTLFLYTDGFQEAVNPGGEEFGIERMEALVAECSDHSVQAASRILTEAVTRFEGGRRPADDKTLVVFRRTQ